MCYTATHASFVPGQKKSFTLVRLPPDLVTKTTNATGAVPAGNKRNVTFDRSILLSLT